MKKFTSKIIVACMAIGACATLSAQTVIKVGASQGAKQTTIQLAYDSVMPAIIEGAYILELQSDYDPTTEVYPIRLKSKTGATATNNITIKPAAGVKKVISVPDSTVVFDNISFTLGANTLTLPSLDGVKAGLSVYGFGLNFLSSPYRYHSVALIDEATKTITLASPTTAASVAGKKTFIGKSETKTIILDGAQYVTIDGVSRTGDTGLEIRNPNAINAQTIYFTNNAKYNTIQNCIIRGANVSGQINNGFAGTIYFMGGQYNTIDKNDVCDMNDPNKPYPICPFQMTAAGGSNNNNAVTNNNVYNISNLHSANGPFTFMQFGSESASTNNVVLNNRFYWTAPTDLSGNIIPINIGTLSSGNRFENNVIGYGAPDGTGVSVVNSPTGTWGTGNGFRFFTCKNNTMGGIQYTGTGFRGFWAYISSSSFAADDILYGNTVKDIVFTSVGNDKIVEGIYVSGNIASNVNVKKNTVSNIQIISSDAANKCTAFGIRANGTGASEINYSENKVVNVVSGDVNSTAANVVYGLYVTANAKNVDRNLIYKLSVNTNNTSAVVRGLQTNGSSLGGQLFANNIVRIGNMVGADVSVTAMYQEAALSAGDPCKIYNNTFYVGGASPAGATKATYGYFRNTGNAHLVDFQNNIVANVRTVSGTISNYAMNINVKTEFSTCNHNLFYYGNNFGYVTTLTAAAPDLATWQNPDGVGLDANSIAADPEFENATADVPDMRIKATSPAKAAGANLTATVAVDFNGFTRTSNDIGALAYGTVSAVETVKPATLGVYGATNAIIVTDMMGKTARIYTMNGQLVKAAQLLSDKENVQVANGLYIVRIGSFSTKVLVK